MILTLDIFKQYINAIKAPQIAFDELLEQNIKNIVIFLLSKSRRFSWFLCTLLPSLFLNLMVYESSADTDNLIKWTVAINKEKILPHLKQWILHKYNIEQFIEEFNTAYSDSNGIVGIVSLAGIIVELNSIEEYEPLMKMMAKERVIHTNINVVMHNNKVLVFFG